MKEAKWCVVCGHSLHHTDSRQEGVCGLCIEEHPCVGVTKQCLYGHVKRNSKKRFCDEPVSKHGRERCGQVLQEIKS